MSANDVRSAEHGAEPPAPQLSVAEVAAQAGTGEGYVRRLVDVGALQPGPSGRLSTEDVPRVRLAAALAQGGIDEERLVWAIDHGLLNLGQFAYMWRSSGSSGRTFADLQASLDAGRDYLPSIYSAFGVGMPTPDAPMREDEERLIRRFIGLWSEVDADPDAAIRAARIAGEGIRRLLLGTIDLFDELGGSPPARQRRGLAVDEANRPSFELAEVMPGLLVWLLDRHLEHEILDRVVRFVQGSLASEQLIEPPPDEEPTVAFVDLSGYTELTADLGDQRAAESAASLQALALRAAEDHHGRVVKLLGDGVMLHFRACEDGVRSTLELMDQVTESGLPPAHAGIATGPLVVRDGDIYGNTVNRASRIAGQAASGELLADHDVGERLSPGTFVIEDVGRVAVKGLPEPIGLVRVRR